MTLRAKLDDYAGILRAIMIAGISAIFSLVYSMNTSLQLLSQRIYDGSRDRPTCEWIEGDVGMTTPSEMTFDDWFAQLKAVAEADGNPDVGEKEDWQDLYEQGLSPQEAWEEDSKEVASGEVSRVEEDGAVEEEEEEEEEEVEEDDGKTTA